MKALLIAVAVALSLGSVAQADPPKDSERPSREEMKKRFMEKFDKNKDGKIDDKEKAAIRAEFAKRRGHAGDREGHGHHKGHEHKKPEAKKSEAKKKGGDAKSDWGKRREEMKKKFMEKYDKNEDGEIDDKEKEAAREAFRQRASEWMKERTEKSAAHLIIELDKNKDRKLNVDEVPEKYRDHFGESDTNNDGYIDEGELTEVLEAVGKKIHEHGKQRIEEHRKRHDK